MLHHNTIDNLLLHPLITDHLLRLTLPVCRCAPFPVFLHSRCFGRIDKFEFLIRRLRVKLVRTRQQLRVIIWLREVENSETGLPTLGGWRLDDAVDCGLVKAT